MIGWVLLIPLLGYGAMRVLTHILPVGDDNVLIQLFVTLVIIGMGLVVPYWMLKTGVHEAHRLDPREREITLADLPKDKSQVAHNRHRHA
jgi:hypothetical protein